MIFNQAQRPIPCRVWYPSQGQVNCPSALEGNHLETMSHYKSGPHHHNWLASGRISSLKVFYNRTYEMTKSIDTRNYVNWIATFQSKDALYNRMSVTCRPSPRCTPSVSFRPPPPPRKMGRQIWSSGGPASGDGGWGDSGLSNEFPHLVRRQHSLLKSCSFSYSALLVIKHFCIVITLGQNPLYCWS